MAVLDTFFLMFDADASGLNDGVNEAKKNTDKLTDAVDKTDKKAGKLGESFGHMLATAGGAMAALLSVSSMMNGITAAVDYADKLNDVSDALGVNIESLDAWGRAVQFSGGTAEGFQSTLSNLSADFAMIATKGTSRTLPFFKELGINLKDAHGNMREVMDVLPDLADKFEKMSKQESIGMGRKLGLDEGTIMLLQRGRREVDEMVKKQKELGVTTKEQAELAGDYNDALDLMSMSFRSMFMSVGQSVIPAFKWIAEAITSVVSFFRKHSDFMTGLFIALGAAIMTFLLPPLISAAGAAIAAFAPFLLMGAIIAGVAMAFALLYDDVMNFIDGNDSLIGDLAAKYPFVQNLIDGISEAFKTMKEVAVEVWGLLGDLIDLAGVKIQAFWDGIGSGVSWFQETFPMLFSIIEMFGEVFGKVFDGVLDMFFSLVDSIGSGLKEVLGAVGIEFSTEGIKNARSQVQAAAGHPLNNVTSNAISNSKTANQSSNVTVGKIEVKTKATDAEGIARAVGGSMQSQLKKATSNHDDGILA